MERSFWNSYLDTGNQTRAEGSELDRRKNDKNFLLQLDTLRAENADLLAALQTCASMLEDAVQVQPQTESDPGGFMSQWDYDADYSVRKAREAIAKATK